MIEGFIEPQQQRSRETSVRLIAATLKALEEYGLEGATIPRIAEMAGTAPASVYRRFRDRNALYRVALLDEMERLVLADRSMDTSGARTLEDLGHLIVKDTLQQYRLRPGFMRALTRFVETDTDEEFRKRAMQSITSGYEHLAGLVLAHRARIKHTDPRKAVLFALLTMATLIEVRELSQVSVWKELSRATDKQFIAEVTKNFLGYLLHPT
jgi:AcrR family transcriptional regulator